MPDESTCYYRIPEKNVCCFADTYLNDKKWHERSIPQGSTQAGRDRGNVCKAQGAWLRFLQSTISSVVRNRRRKMVCQLGLADVSAVVLRIMASKGKPSPNDNGVYVHSPNGDKQTYKPLKPTSYYAKALVLVCWTQKKFPACLVSFDSP